MSIATHDLIRELFATLDRQDTRHLDRFLAPDYRLHAAGASGPMDVSGFIGWMNVFFAGFPDVSHTVEDLLHEGDRAAVRLTIRGSNTGSFQGMPPTGRPIEIGAINVFRLAGDKVAEQWIQADLLGTLQQLGVVPGPSPS
jgi:predicted ester cyclase